MLCRLVAKASQHDWEVSGFNRTWRIIQDEHHGAMEGSLGKQLDLTRPSRKLQNKKGLVKGIPVSKACKTYEL